jgi:predicted dehydrogenase
MAHHQILLVGTGQMAREYIKVLFHLGVAAEEIQVVGRSRAKAGEFAQEFGVSCLWGGTPALAEIPVFERAIIAVSHLELAEVTMALLQKGYRSILLEKPGALYKSQLNLMQEEATRRAAQIFVAFNRRFYDSVDAARRMVSEDGGLLSCSFDFTEVERLVLMDQDRLPEPVLHRWGVVNSLHVIDLFLYLAGMPANWTCQQGGSLHWHPRNAIFCGSGVTERGIFFSYLATWAGAGRWGLELTTPSRKLFLRPLETLEVQHKGQFDLERAALDPEGIGLKPGLLGQVKSFLSRAPGEEGDTRLCPIAEATLHFGVAEQILGYDQSNAS